MQRIEFTLDPGGQRLCLDKGTLQRISPDLLLPMADTHANDSIALDTSSLVGWAVRVAVAALKDTRDATTQLLVTSWEPEGAPALYCFADRYGLQDLMHTMEWECALRPCLVRQCTVQAALQRFEWHPGMVNAMLGDLQTRITQDGALVQQVGRLLSARPMTLITSDVVPIVPYSTCVRARAQGCIVVCWDVVKRAYGVDRTQFPSRHVLKDLPIWLAVAWTSAFEARRQVRFTVLEPLGRSETVLHVADPASWLKPSDTCREYRPWGFETLVELEDFVVGRMPLVQLMVDGASGTIVLHSSYACAEVQSGSVLQLVRTSKTHPGGFSLPDPFMQDPICVPDNWPA